MGKQPFGALLQELTRLARDTWLTQVVTPIYMIGRFCKRLCEVTELKYCGVCFALIKIVTRFDPRYRSAWRSFMNLRAVVATRLMTISWIGVEP